ncbi:hypothetical protein U9M48_042057 [Paspalum notatum var. saurae]|uniref:Uncharacterized protein n=1 Tax=Paspalum notatum var. saurae TaxID=547442 RepID=A0AAQ3UQ43_PASNO
MAQMVVSASKGVIGPLLGKLTDLIGDKYSANLLGIPDGIVFLKNELSSISVLLDKLQDTDELDPQVKNWRDQVREISYDIEDCIDDFINKVGSTDENAGFARKVCHFLQTLRAHVEAAKQIKELRTRLHEINERRKRYKFFEDCALRTTLVDADPRLSALYKESSMLVGIEYQKEEIMVQIKDGGEQLKVVSVVGFGGSGKTTLAKEVYRDVRGEFECTAFVSVSQKPDIRQLLSRVISKLKQQESSHACDVQDHIKTLREYLRKKSLHIHWSSLISSQEHGPGR